MSSCLLKRKGGKITNLVSGQLKMQLFVIANDQSRPDVALSSDLCPRFFRNSVCEHVSSHLWAQGQTRQLPKAKPVLQWASSLIQSADYHLPECVIKGQIPRCVKQQEHMLPRQVQEIDLCAKRPGQVQLGVLMDIEYLSSVLAFYQLGMCSSGKSAMQSKDIVLNAAVKRQR